MKTAESTFEIDSEPLLKGKNTLRAINHLLRQKMIQLIHEHGRMTVTDLYVKLRLEQSVASQHLAILRNEDYVITKREGKCIYYSVNYQRIDHVHELSSLLSKK
jgi:DNA-binding transcriptional ArsR family regulator